MDSTTAGIISGLVLTLTGGNGLMLRALIKHGEQIRKDSKEVREWVQGLVENHLHNNTLAMQQVANGFNHMADVIGSCEAVQEERRRHPPAAPSLPTIVPKMTGD